MIKQPGVAKIWLLLSTGLNHYGFIKENGASKKQIPSPLRKAQSLILLERVVCVEHVKQTHPPRRNATSRGQVRALHAPSLAQSAGRRLANQSWSLLNRTAAFTWIQQQHSARLVLAGISAAPRRRAGVFAQPKGRAIELLHVFVGPVRVNVAVPWSATWGRMRIPQLMRDGACKVLKYAGAAPTATSRAFRPTSRMSEWQPDLRARCFLHFADPTRFAR